MTFNELVNLFRVESGDEANGRLWSDDLVKGSGSDPGYINSAYFEAVERARMIRDKDTPGCCQIAVVDGTAEYTLHASVISIYRAKLASQKEPLLHASSEELDDTVSNWEADEGRPGHYLHEEGDAKIRLYPIPTSNDTLQMTVYRRPLVYMTQDSDTPIGIPLERDQRMLIKWALYLALSRQDGDAYNPQGAAEAAAEFAAYFGERHTAKARLKRGSRRPRQVAYGGY